MSDTAVVTPEARLAIALSELAAHSVEIAAAYDEQDYANARVLEEAQIGYLDDVATAADALLDGQIVVTIRVENTYDTGEDFVHHMTVTAPAPADGQDVDDWAAEHLMQFTGEGPEYSATEGLYEVEVTACDARPELVGAAASAQG